MAAVAVDVDVVDAADDADVDAQVSAESDVEIDATGVVVAVTDLSSVNSV